MQHREGIRKMGRVGACLAFVSSILMFTGPASAAAQEVATAHRQGNYQFSVQLTGNELRDGGDRDGRGAAWLKFDPYRETACYFISWERLRGAVTAFHLHVAPRRSDGPHWIDFFNDRHLDGERGTWAWNCVHSPRGKILAIVESPSEFYLNLHTTAYEKGALRGQLG